MKQYKPNTKKNIALMVISIIFLLIAIAIVVIANLSEIGEWFRNCGIALLAVSSVFFIWLLFKIISDKIKGM